MDLLLVRLFNPGGWERGHRGDFRRALRLIKQRPASKKGGFGIQYKINDASGRFELQPLVGQRRLTMIVEPMLQDPGSCCISKNRRQQF